MPSLVVCHACTRHVRISERRCPFCATAIVAHAPARLAPPERFARAALLALGASAASVACGTPSQTNSASLAVTAPTAPAAVPNAPAETTVSPVTTGSTPVPAASSTTSATPSIAPTSLADLPSSGMSGMAAAYGAPPPNPAAMARGPLVEIGSPTVTGGTLSDLDTVVSGLKTSFASCVAKGRSTKPDIAGTATVTIRVGTAGQVLGVAVQQSTKIPAPVASCLSTRAATADFKPPQGAKTQVTVVLPVEVPKP